MRPWFHVSISSQLDTLKVSMDAIENYFGSLDQISANNSNVRSRNATELRTEIRKLRRTRNKIEGIKEKQDEGGILEEADIALLNEEESIMLQLREFEYLLRLDS